MRNANSQRANSMIPVCASQQPPSPHVSHAETEGETSDQPAFAAAQLRRGTRIAKASSRLAAPKL
jgi:hypothetical protein